VESEEFVQHGIQRCQEFKGARNEWHCRAALRIIRGVVVKG